MKKSFALYLGAILSVSLIGAAAAGEPPQSTQQTMLAPINHSPINPHRNFDGSLKRTPKNQLMTNNWSGYAIANFETGQYYTSASTTWQVPAVTYGASSTTVSQYSSEWLGIGGYCENSGCSVVDQTMIQLGTDEAVSSTGTTLYYAWYEMLPAGSLQINNPVKPGDIMTASIACISSCTPNTTQTWALAMTDQTAGWTWQQNFSYQTTLLSGEWIVEAPYAGGVLPLADYQQATFGGNTINGTAPTITLSTNSIVMYDSWGQTSNPSDLSASWFSTCWGSGSLTPCTAGSFTAPPPTTTVSLVATPNSISSGQSTMLTWSSANASSCSGSGFTASATSGSVNVSPAATTTYSVNCTGNSKSAVATTTVNVTPTSTPTTSGGGSGHGKHGK